MTANLRIADHEPPTTPVGDWIAARWGVSSADAYALTLGIADVAARAALIAAARGRIPSDSEAIEDCQGEIAALVIDIIDDVLGGE